MPKKLKAGISEESAPKMSEFTQAFFEASSKAWTANKTRYGQASYTYKTNAFPPDLSVPKAPKQTALNRAELKRRQAQDDEAPPRIRRSPRLLEEHRKQTYR